MAKPEQHGGLGADLERIARLLPAPHLHALADQLETAARDGASGDLLARLKLAAGKIVGSSYSHPELVL